MQKTRHNTINSGEQKLPYGRDTSKQPVTFRDLFCSCKEIFSNSPQCFTIYLSFKWQIKLTLWLQGGWTYVNNKQQPRILGLINKAFSATPVDELYTVFSLRKNILVYTFQN